MSTTVTPLTNKRRVNKKKKKAVDAQRGSRNHKRLLLAEGDDDLLFPSPSFLSPAVSRAMERLRRFRASFRAEATSPREEISASAAASGVGASPPTSLEEAVHVAIDAIIKDQTKVCHFYPSSFALETGSFCSKLCSFFFFVPSPRLPRLSAAGRAVCNAGDGAWLHVRPDQPEPAARGGQPRRLRLRSFSHAARRRRQCPGRQRGHGDPPGRSQRPPQGPAPPHL